MEDHQSPAGLPGVKSVGMGVEALGWDPLLPVYPWAPAVCPSRPQTQVPVGEVLLPVDSSDMAPAHRGFRLATTLPIGEISHNS